MHTHYINAGVAVGSILLQESLRMRMIFHRMKMTFRMLQDKEWGGASEGGCGGAPDHFSR